MAPLLPPGDTLEEDKGPVEAKTISCKLFADKRFVLFATIWQLSEYPDPMDPEQSFSFTNRKEIKGLPVDQKGALGDRAAMIIGKCAAPDKNVLVEVSVNASFAKDVEQRRKNVERFTKSFMGDIKKDLGCTA
ncbi:hypothetical protein ACFUJR_21460 [Streptomyces sp. NPDC057271]|uniref:hypothetical protein n=1 Tax=unclassified Streptomyces TaxID=2593676 RepID=UPI00362F2ED6